MDTRLGEFAPISEGLAKELRENFGEKIGVFQEGEELEIRGSHFKVVSIGTKYLRLELLER